MTIVTGTPSLVGFITWFDAGEGELKREASGPGDLVRWRRVEACARTGWEFLWVYRLKHAGPFVLHPEEIERGEWVVPAELTARMREQPAEFTPAFRLIWEQIGAEAGG